MCCPEPVPAIAGSASVNPMRKPITPERLAERICRRLELAVDRCQEVLEALLRESLVATRDASIAATKAACLEIAEEEAERSRGVGATASQQTALTIAARIRKRHVECR